MQGSQKPSDVNKRGRADFFFILLALPCAYLLLHVKKLSSPSERTSDTFTKNLSSHFLVKEIHPTHAVCIFTLNVNMGCCWEILTSTCDLFCSAKASPPSFLRFTLEFNQILLLADSL